MNPQIQTVLQQAIQAFQDGNFDSADLILQEVLQKDINSADTFFELGIAYAKANRFSEASVVFCCLQPFKNDDIRIPYNLGLIYSLQGRHQLALQAYELALKIQPDDAEVLINKGSTCNDIKNHALALEVLEKAIQIKPYIPEAWSNKGIALNNLHFYQESINAYNEAIKLNPNYYEAWSNKSAPLNKLKLYTEALHACDKALSLKPDYMEAWNNKGNILIELRRYDEALAHYDKALSLKPDYMEGWSNKGVTLNELKRYDEALAHYDKALSLNPNYAEAWSNKGVTLDELKRYDEALAHYDKALNLNPDYAEAWSNKGVTLRELKLFNESIVHFEKALMLKPDIDWIYGDLLHTKLRICRWSGWMEDSKNIVKKVMAGEKVTPPFVLLAIGDDGTLLKKAAQIFVQNKYSIKPSLPIISRLIKKKKIRIAYFSPDFKNHPVSLLAAELFEIHNRQRFEVFAFSLQKATIDDQIHLRIKRSFDKFLEVQNLSDKEVAQIAREYEVDIAVDLAGCTQNSRTAIFSYRAAPIQVNWLGYPGTIGMDCIDYIVGDKTIIPEPHRKFYVEKVVHLPNSYMVDDSKRLMSSKVFTKSEFGIPNNKFIFCCFNNDYKFNSKVLDSWSRIMLKADKSVLWISENNKLFKDNIKVEFEKRGINLNRIFFAQRLESMGDYLARCSLADLFLDTNPYNAHTTAVDSLKSGVPVLTMLGQSFASRVAASLLNAIGLPELITTSQDEYEAMAIDLATNLQKLAAIKEKLAKNRLTTPLFDTPLFTKNLEAAYTQMYERHQAGLPPDHIWMD
jgi:protein O-GlcNAc transferase